MFLVYDYEGDTRVEKLSADGKVLSKANFNLDAYPNLKAFLADLESTYGSTTAQMCDHDTTYRIVAVKKTGRVFDKHQDHALAFTCDPNGDMRTISSALKTELQTIVGLI